VCLRARCTRFQRRGGGIAPAVRPTERIKARFIDDAGFLATNLASDHTGVEGAVVWIFAGEFSRADAHHGPRLLVVPGRGRGVGSLIDAVAVTIANPPEVLGCLPDKIEPQVIEWVELNRDVLLKYWRGGMATDDAIELLVRV
jgi:hypothetical protein